jgi:hypothetical protein
MTPWLWEWWRFAWGCPDRGSDVWMGSDSYGYYYRLFLLLHWRGAARPHYGLYWAAVPSVRPTLWQELTRKRG